MNKLFPQPQVVSRMGKRPAFTGKLARLTNDQTCFVMLTLIPAMNTKKRIHLGTVRCLRTLNCFKGDARIVRWPHQYSGRRIIAAETLPPRGWTE